jgi:hypothetical protein
MKVISRAAGLGAKATDLQRLAQPLLEPKPNGQLKGGGVRRGTRQEPATKLTRHEGAAR